MKMDLKKYLLTGIATVVPLVATVYILMWLIQWVDGISQPSSMRHREEHSRARPCCNTGYSSTGGIFVSYSGQKDRRAGR